MKNTKIFSDDTEKLNKENASLAQQLKVALETIDLIKSGKTDASVVTYKNELTLTTAVTTDKTYRILIEKMHEGAAAIDKAGTILFCNSSFANIMDLTIQKVIGEKLKNFITVSSKGPFDTLLQKGWKFGFVRHKNQLVKKEGVGASPPISINYFKLDNYLFLSVILIDTTVQNKAHAELKLRALQIEQKCAELKHAVTELTFLKQEKEKRTAELHAAKKELVFQQNEKKKNTAELKSVSTDVKKLKELVAHKDSILTLLSHDLRSPLTGIVATAEYLKSNFEKINIPTLKEMLYLICEASKEELNMLDYLVEWGRIKYAADVFSPSKLELVLYVNKVFEILKDNALLNTINLHHEIEENTCVFADGKMLLSILQNIVSNAIKYSRPNEIISLTAKRQDDKIILEIKDSGIGMSKAVVKNLFTPQMEILSKERIENKGAGIGLLLVKGFIEKNGGQIWVESTEGVGSSFYFTLPINKN